MMSFSGSSYHGPLATCSNCQERFTDLVSTSDNQWLCKRCMRKRHANIIKEKAMARLSEMSKEEKLDE